MPEIPTIPHHDSSLTLAVRFRLGQFAKFRYRPCGTKATQKVDPSEWRCPRSAFGGYKMAEAARLA